MEKYEEAYKTYYPFLLSSLYMKINNFHDAEEICQEVFINFMNKFDTIEKEKQLSWIFKASWFEIQKYYNKKKKKFDSFNIDDYEKNLTYFNGDRDISIIVNEAMNDDRNFKDSEEKIVFTLNKMYNYNYQELSDLLGLTLRQIRYKIKETDKRIAHYFKEKGIKLEDFYE